MNPANFLSSEQMSSIFTTFSSDTIRRHARNGLLPVASWDGADPVFARTPETARAMLICGGLLEDA